MASNPAEVWTWESRLEEQFAKFTVSGLFKERQIRVLRGFLSDQVLKLKTERKDKTTIQKTVYRYVHPEGGQSDAPRACARIAQRIRPQLERYYKKHSDDPGPVRITMPKHPGWFPEVVDLPAAAAVSSQAGGRRRSKQENEKPVAFMGTSDQQKLRRLLKSPIHAYHLTQDPDGNPAWYHKVLTFESKTTDGSLVAYGVNLPANTTDSDREEHRYKYEAWLDRRHLIVRTRREDEQSTDISIQVFPKVGESQNRPPWWGMDAITTTWTDNPAMTISIWNPEQELECARGAPDGKPISDPGITQAVENVWRKAAGRARAVQLPSSIRHFKTDAEAFMHLANLYSSENLSPKLLRIRDTHGRAETRPLGYGDNYRENGAAFGKFLARGDQHATRAVVILGDKVDEDYVSSFLQEPVKGHEHKIEFFRLAAPILSFIILTYDDGSDEVFFGWGRLGSASETGVFASKDHHFVQAFSHYFEMLKDSATPVSLASLLSPAAQPAASFPKWLYKASGSTSPAQWLYALESKVLPNSVVYVVTPDLYNDARNLETIALVRANHQRGITYKFFTQDSQETRTNIKLAMQNYADFSSHESGRFLSFIYLAPELFQTPQCNVLVIEQDEDGHRRVFVELPVHERKERVWWVEADPDTAEWWHTKLQELAKRESLPNPFKRS